MLNDFLEETSTDKLIKSDTHPLIMNLIFIYGHPGTGKLTVAKELARITNLKIFHNHLAVNLVRSTFEFGTKPFIELRERIWLDVFEASSRSRIPGLIFTFAFEKTFSKLFIENIEKTLSKNDQINFIELFCEMEELKKRVELPSRKKYGKLSSSIKLEEFLKKKICFTPKLNKPVLRIDNTKLSARKVAKEIKEHFEL